MTANPQFLHPGPLRRLIAGAARAGLGARAFVAGLVPGSNPLGPGREAVRAAVAELEASLPRWESEFIRLGGLLENQSEISRRLIAEGESLLGYVTGRSGGIEVLQNGTDILREPLELIERCDAHSRHLLEAFNAQLRALDQLERHRLALAGTIAPLKYVQTLFRVESARLPGDMQGIFIGLTREIEDLRLKGEEVFGEQFRMLDKSRLLLRGLVEKIVTRTARRHAMAAERRAELERTLAELRAELETNAGREVSLITTSRAISAAVDRIIMALQVQDIVGQKLQHVLDACGDLEASTGRDGGVVGLPTGTRRDAVLYVRESAALQARQSHGALADLAGAEDEARRGLQEILGLAAGLDSECVALTGHKSASASSDGMVQLLLNGLEQLRPLVAEVVDVQGEIHATLEPLSGQASNLTGVMSRLAGNIKLIALNAQIQAAQVGCGTGLEVLSERTTRISEEIYRLNAEVSAELDVVISGIDDTVAESAALHRDALGIRDRLAGASGDVERRLHAYRDAALAAFMEVGRTAEQLVARNAESLAALKFSASAAAVIEPLCAALDTLAAAAATAAGDARPGDDTPRMLEDLRARYTMRSERVVHAAGAGATAPGAASNPAREPASEPGTDTPPDAADKGQPVPSPAAEFF